MRKGWSHKFLSLSNVQGLPEDHFSSAIIVQQYEKTDLFFVYVMENSNCSVTAQFDMTVWTTTCQRKRWTDEGRYSLLKYWKCRSIRYQYPQLTPADFPLGYTIRYQDDIKSLHLILRHVLHIGLTQIEKKHLIISELREWGQMLKIRISTSISQCSGN